MIQFKENMQESTCNVSFFFVQYIFLDLFIYLNKMLQALNMQHMYTWDKYVRCPTIVVNVVSKTD